MPDKVLNLRRKQRHYCPFIKGVDHELKGDEMITYDEKRQCREKVTRTFFQHVCNSGANFKECKSYAKKMDELAVPIKWLQREAVDRDKRGDEED